LWMRHADRGLASSHFLHFRNIFQGPEGETPIDILLKRDSEQAPHPAEQVAITVDTS
jgi:hypothetical protein